MKRIDAFLNDQIRKAWPGSVVYCVTENGSSKETWILEYPLVFDCENNTVLPGEVVTLGDRFAAARGSVDALIEQEVVNLRQRAKPYFPNAKITGNGDVNNYALTAGDNQLQRTGKLHELREFIEALEEAKKNKEAS